MLSCQPGILEPIPPLARYLIFARNPNEHPAQTLQALARAVDGVQVVAGLGASTVQALDATIPGLRPFPVIVHSGIDIPSTPAGLWLWLRGEDRGDLVQATRRFRKLLAPAFQLTQVVDAFRWRTALDLTGYEDGTENPTGEEAVATACVQGQGEGLDGSSFVATQQWLHDLDFFESLPPQAQDFVFGRRKSDNEEIEDAPPSAHIKRTAQEDFEPEAFVLRRSMPWADSDREGFFFVAFGHSFYAFEAQLKRMAGVDDGIVDAIFTYSRPLTGAYFWCPPMRNGQLDLRALGLDG
jgi:putative iron-dependent peroxidase